jgi:hypothetical protein
MGWAELRRPDITGWATLARSEDDVLTIMNQLSESPKEASTP